MLLLFYTMQSSKKSDLKFEEKDGEICRVQVWGNLRGRRTLYLERPCWPVDTNKQLAESVESLLMSRQQVISGGLEVAGVLPQGVDCSESRQ